MNATTALFQVPGITCGYCKKSIEGALRPIDGVADATVNLADKTVTITRDAGQVAWNDVAEAIEDCGYDVAGHEEVNPS